MHPFNTPKYTREVIMPAIEEGAKKAGRKLSDIDIVGGGFLITGKNEEEMERAKAPFKQQIAFYALHALLPPGAGVPRLGRGGRCACSASPWRGSGRDGDAITDEMLEQFAIVGTYDEIVPKIKERYYGVATTLDFGYSTIPTDQEERLRWMVQELKKL